MNKRQIYQNIWKILSPHKQMVFISGPRQCGKTTFSKIISKTYKNSLYFNWDMSENKKKLIQNNSFYEDINLKDSSKPIIIFDEIHKYSEWKNYLKGIYDRDSENYKFLVTGSGRLDLYRKGGDSLAGRYFLFHLWPFTLGELGKRNRQLKDFISDPLKIEIKNEKSIRKIWNNLAMRSGFPDPYLSNDTAFYNIWSETYKKQLIREDVRDLTGIKKIDHLEILYSILPDKIGNPVSINNISRELKVSFDSVKSWLQAFDNFFITFRIPTWTKKIARAILKEKKIYLFDYASIENEAIKFENMTAVELMRFCTNHTEMGVGKFEFFYVRNKDGQEVDFLISRNNKPFLLIECKLSDTHPAKSLKKIQLILKIPAIQLVNEPGICKIVSNGTNKILIITADQWLSALP